MTVFGEIRIDSVTWLYSLLDKKALNIRQISGFDIETLWAGRYFFSVTHNLGPNSVVRGILWGND